ncbi:hypothetical protein D3C72_768960 [compost metagenome]
MQIQQTELADSYGLKVVVPAYATVCGHLGNFRFRILPSLGRGFAYQRGDPQAELQRRQIAAELFTEVPEPLDPFAHAGKRFSPEKLHIGLGCGNLLGCFGSAAEIEFGMRSAFACGDTWRDGGVRHPEMVAIKRDVFLGPEPPYQPHEFFRARITLRLITFFVAIGGKLIPAGDDVDPHPAGGKLIERGGGRCEVGRLPVAGTDSDQRLECGGARRKRRRHRKCIRTSPAGADQRAFPAMGFKRPGMARQCIETVVVFADGVAPVAGFDVIGDVPEKFARAAHIIRLNFRFMLRWNGPADALPSPLGARGGASLRWCENGKAAAARRSSDVSFVIRQRKSFPSGKTILHIFSI